MGISKKLLEEEHENFIDEYIYMQALYYEWEQWEHEELKKEVGRIHTELPKEKTKEDESNSEFIKLPF